MSGALNLQTLQDTHYRKMVMTVSDYAIFFIDLNGAVLSWNAGARLLIGYEAAEVVGQHIAKFYPAELLEQRWPEHELLVARRDGRTDGEGWRLRKDGTRFWASVVITRLDDEAGVPIGFSKITRDLSERRRQEELLRAGEEKFRLLVEGVKDYAIFMLDPSGFIVSWNRGAQQNKGYEAAEIIGKHFSVFYPPEVTAQGWPEEELRNALRDGRFEDEGWRVRKDGSRFWASVVITTLRDAAGVHRGFAKVTRDLSERRRVRALEDDGRRITNFLAMLGHELRNPLAPISNAVELLEREPDPSKMVRFSREIIGRQLKQMTKLVDDLLDVGRITTGRIHLEMKPIKLQNVLNDAVATVQPLGEQRRQSIEVIDEVPDPWVAGDAARLVQVLSNLLHNAIKFTPPGGRIQLRVSTNQDKIDITVKDNGCGIAPGDLQRVFDLFVQGEQDSARSLGGLGLGLSLVQQLVALHGGTVSAFSAGRPGEGSEFLVQLPRISAPGIIHQPEPGEPVVETLLVVDDNQDAANSLALVLEDLGYTTEVVYSGKDALEITKARPVAAVLLDLGMPDMSGMEVAISVKNTMAFPPPLIAVTGYGQDTDRRASRDAGFFAHLTKPVDVGALDGLLQRILKGSRENRPALPRPTDFSDPTGPTDYRTRNH